MINVNLTKDASKEEVKKAVEKYLDEIGLNIASHDFTRPWGGFFVLDETQAEKFIQLYFSHLKKEDLTISGKLSPKILIVAPGQRLSWQYHHRRAEIWKLIAGVAGVVTSTTDRQGELKKLALNEVIHLKQGERHRLVGLPEGWGMIAEIWQHTDASHPSDENDIVRVQDDFGR
ncbi:MAG: Mannose-1-phosphate guanylyltransferase/mannose-6-phosphate isomerase [Cytophagales bacterium]|jgi:mannose-6-phosphate isomerase-like protein (cupin superfamily)|nr:phosphoheptose isomerase [Bacteroidota bacterium]MBS1979583.1 phosphoheptose isomerase [Bacteroidota bacterium]WHZ09216.1 MAG: Mannose-1-phosphate guanylyltransferase/mannose-6-phosphate isomerase [Cytophagales bacterium]